MNMVLKRFIPTLLLVLLVILSSITIASIPLAYAQSRPGPPSDLIIYDVVTKVEDGILRVIKGEADIFYWPVTRSDIDRLGLKPEDLQKVHLIPQTTTLNALLFNPYCDDTELGKYGVATSVKDNKTYFNPFALREFRYAMNFLISRKYIVEEIMRGSANPQYTVIGPSHPAYPQIETVIKELGLIPEGDFDKAKAMIEELFSKVSEGLREHGYDLVKESAPDSPAGYWWVFKRPDGSKEIVTITFLIRVEDERRQIGDYVASLLEKIGIKVSRVYIERGQVFRLVYGADPRTLDWHIYTEGWVSVAESPWIEWDIAWYYAGWFYGLLPTWMHIHWGYTAEHEEKLWGETIQKKIEEESLKLTKGVYKGDKYWEVARELIKLGIMESIRVFLTENVQFFLVNKRVTNLVPGRTTGLYSPFVLRTATTVDGIIRIVQYSAEAALFMSAWNPVGGMTDIYSTNIWRFVREYGGYWHPTTGEYIPMATTWSIKYNVTIDPEKIYVYKAGWMTLKEYLEKYPDDWRAEYVEKVVPVEIVFNYKPGAFHDGEDMILWDIVFNIAWYWEWATNDTDVRGEDPWYHPGIESSMAPIFTTLVGLRIVNETAIALYGTYTHPVSESEIAAYYMFYTTWSPAVWTAMEYCVIHKGPVSGKTYGWHEGEAERYIDALSKDHLVDIKAALEILVKGEYIPPHIESTNKLLEEFKLPVKDLADAANKALKFIEKYGHAVIGNGPFYISKYLPAELHLELEAFRDPRYPFTEDYWIKKLPYILLEVKAIKISAGIIAPGEKLVITVEVVDHMISPEEKIIPTEKAWVEVVLISPAGEIVYRKEGVMVEKGKWVIEIPEEVTEGLAEGSYTLQIRIGRFPGISEIVREIPITVLGLKKEVRELGKRVEELGAKVEEIGKSVEAVREELSKSIEEVRSELEARLGAIAKDIADAISGLKEAITKAIGETSKAIEETGSVIKESSAAISSSIDELRSAVDDLKSGIEGLKKDISGVKTVMEEQATKLDEISSMLATVQWLVVIALILSVVSIGISIRKR